VVSKLSVVGTVEVVEIDTLGTLLVVAVGISEFGLRGALVPTRCAIHIPPSNAGPASLTIHIAIRLFSSSVSWVGNGRLLTRSSEFTALLHYPSTKFGVVPKNFPGWPTVMSLIKTP
jgi:hypothetical protein